MISLVNKGALENITLKEEELSFIETLSQNLANRKLKGHTLWKKEDIAKLSPQEIDISRGLFIEAFSEDRDACRNHRDIGDIAARISDCPSQLVPFCSPRAAGQLLYILTEGLCCQF